MPVPILAGDDHLEPGMALENRREACEQRLRDDEEPRAAVAQHKIVITSRQQRVDGNRHDSRLDRAEESGREVDAVEQAEQDALLRRDAEADGEIGEAVDPLGEIAVAVGAAIVANGDLLAAPRLEVAVDEIDGGVVVAWQWGQGWLPAAFSTLPDHRASPRANLCVGPASRVLRDGRSSLP